MNKNFKAGQQGGFTLIELIVVIVILGILAATALPRFANLGGEARIASLRAAKGAIASASSMVRAQSLVRPADVTAGFTTIEGQRVNLVNGYPSVTTVEDGNALAAAAGINTSGSTDYTVTAAANLLTISPAGATTPNNCRITYAAATATAPPTITEVATGC